jgi:hypothetical protein
MRLSRSFISENSRIRCSLALSRVAVCFKEDGGVSSISHGVSDFFEPAFAPSSYLEEEQSDSIGFTAACFCAFSFLEEVQSADMCFL